MGIRIRPKMYTQRDVPLNTDRVIGMQVLPAESRLNGLSGTCHVIGTTNTPRMSADFYGLHAYVLPILIPDATITPDAIWDNQVPKDKALTVADGLDLDQDTADVTSAFEMGLPTVEAMMGLGDPAIQVFNRTRMITIADGANGYDRTADNWVATDKFKLGITRPVRVDVPSICLFGFSSPETTTTLTAYFVPDTDSEWAMLHYLEWSLMQAFIHLVGLIETGAETPYVDAATLVAQIIETTFEETAGRFNPIAWNVIAEWTWDVTMFGDMQKVHLSGQR